MEDQVNRLVQKTWTKYKTLPPNERLLIAISGIPGSGKTTLATTVTTRLNTLSSSTSSIPNPASIATYIPMDGYHFPLSYLHSLPDPTHALARRGAPFTFDSSSYLSLIKALRPPITPSTPTIHAPSFSHTTKDPIMDAIPIPASSRILIFEGNYLSLDEGDWREAAGLMDEHWFVEVEEEVAGRRLVQRHVKSGVAEDEEGAWRRARENDLPNGREIVEGRRKGIDEVLISREDESWRAVGEE
ncbi:phosphoribulokinase/uridine kinase [Rhexocercosporidium sp. MPI-PUGE-AT-0058]|nr:phosphoribulokinase/uridine kinase [Rhexocercosporidium sp. MPI-PUGE-AT-0058]